jgi:hypothetical protein
MPIEPPQPLRIFNTLVNVLAELRVLAADHPALMGELRRLAAERAGDELLVIVLDAVTKQ